jgi:hypothetical protein
MVAGLLVKIPQPFAYALAERPAMILIRETKKIDIP